MPKPLKRTETLRGMRMSTWEGLVASWWLALVVGVIPQGFALYLDASPFVIGLLGSLQALAGLASLVGGYLSERRSERRLFVAALAGGGRTLWFLVAAAAIFLGRESALCILLLVVSLSWAMTQAATPAWTSWMNDLVPQDMRGRYYSRRSLIIGVFTLVAAPLSGRFLDLGQQAFGPRAAFALLFAAAGTFGLLNALTLYLQPEPPPHRVGAPPALNLDYFRSPLRDPAFGRFLRAIALWAFAQSIAGPFFTVYMLEVLHLSFFQVQLLGGLSSVITLMVTPAVGFLLDKYGNKPIYIIGYVLVTTIPLFWSLTRTDMPVFTWVVIAIVQVLNGIVAPAMNLSQFNLMLRLSPSEHTARYAAVWSTVIGVAGFLGPLLGGAIANAATNADFVLDRGGWEIGAYKLTFIVSSALRMLVIPMLKRVPESESAEVREVLGRMAGSRPLASVRHLRRLRGPAAPAQRVRSVQELGRIKERLAFEELEAALNDPVLAVRRQAAIALGELGDIRALEPLLAKVRDAEAGSRVQAIVALGKLKDARAVPTLLDAIEASEGDMALVQAAVRALGALRDPRAADALLRIAREPGHPARNAAMQGLGDIGATSHAGPLADVLRQDMTLSPQDVSALGGALARLGRTDALLPLMARLPESHTMLMRQDLAIHIGALISRSDVLYGWMALDEFAREEALTHMLNGHVRDLRRAGLPSAALRTEAAAEAMAQGDIRTLMRHLRVAFNKVPGAPHGPWRDALEWLAARSREADLWPEETLLALYAFHVGMRIATGGRPPPF